MSSRTVVLMVVAVLLTIATPMFIARNLQLGDHAKSPQEAQVRLASTVVVAGGRARIWFAGGTTGGDFEIQCGSDSKYVMPEFETKYEGCGIQVELLEIMDTVPPKGKFRVTWK